MKSCIKLSSLSRLPSEVRRVVVAAGVFDGVHRGHQEIFARLRRLAEAEQAVPVALYFEPFPKAVLFPEEAPLRLATGEQRLRFLADCGIPYCLEMTFTRELAALTPAEFLENFLDREDGGPEVLGFCVGEGWRFGCRNSGTAEFLRDYLRERGRQACLVPPLWHDGEIISSTRIRAAVAAGRLAEAAAMLGRNYSLAGTVVHGMGKAHADLKYPTANFSDDSLQYPPFGVYAARTCVWEDGGANDSIVYIGDAPTIRVNEKGRVVTEIHFLDAAPELYGKHLEVELLEFLRPSCRFADVEALREQIGRDIARTREILHSH